MRRSQRLELLLRAWCAFGLVCLLGCNTFHGNANNQTGMQMFDAGNYAQARVEFQRAVADEPWNADYLHNLAAAFRREGDDVAAERVYRQALARNPGHQPSYHGLASLMRTNGRSAEARELLTSWQGAEPYSAEPHIELAWLDREQGNLTGAERHLQRALRIKPNDHVAAAQLGSLYEETNQTDRAYALYRRSLYTNRNQPEIAERASEIAASRWARNQGGPANELGPGQPLYLEEGIANEGVYQGPVTGPTITSRPLGGFANTPINRGAFGPTGRDVSYEIIGGDPAHSDREFIDDVDGNFGFDPGGGQQVTQQPPVVIPR